jgi:hypothetical protein
LPFISERNRPELVLLAPIESSGASCDDVAGDREVRVGLVRLGVLEGVPALLERLEDLEGVLIPLRGIEDTLRRLIATCGSVVF